MSLALAQAQDSTGEGQGEHSPRDAARQLAVEGVRAYETKDFVGASERLDKAFQLLSVPSLGLWSARALEKRGLLMEAADRYLAAIRAPSDSGGDEAVQKEAREEARHESSAVQERIARVVIQVDGADASSVKVTVGGKVTRDIVVGSHVPVNPGQVEVIGTSGDESQRVEVEVGEGQTVEVNLVFGNAPLPVQHEVAPLPVQRSPKAETPEAFKKKHNGLRWVGLGTGVAGLLAVGVGIGLGFKAVADADNAGCDEDLECDNDAYEKRGDAITLLKASYGIGIAGGLLVVGGTTLFLISPKASSKEVAVRVHGSASGFSGLSLRGNF